jgi:heat shock protein HslJ
VIVTDGNGLSSYATTHVNIDARLDTDVWTLAEFDKKPLVTGTAITLQFLKEELVGFAGCNTYSGDYIAKDNGDGTYTIDISPLTVTRLNCPKDVMDQEDEYLKVLQQATTATIKENEIILKAPADELIFYLVEPD